MKHIILLLFLLITVATNAQNVTVSNIIHLYNLDVTDSEEYMSKLNWNFSKNEDDGDGLAYLTFTQKDANNNVIYLSKTYGKNKFVALSFYSKTKKNSYVNELKNKGFKPLDKSMDDGSIVETYIKNDVSFTISTKPNNEYFIACGVYHH